MNTPSGLSLSLWPLAVYSAAVLMLVASMMTLSALLGQRHQERATGEPYESGMVTTGSARIRLSVDFYLVALLFVIFDVEAVFIIAWAIAVREAGWTGYLGVLFFLAVLAAALLYEWRVGALDWGGRQGWRPPLPSDSHPLVRSDSQRAARVELDRELTKSVKS